MAKANLPHEEVKRFEVYDGKTTEQMPKLVADNRIPISVSQLMQRRLDLRNDETGVKASYTDNYFDTGDAVVYHPDGRVKIVLDSEDLRNITPNTPRNGGALIITPEAYNTLQGEEFKKDKLGKTNDWMSRKDVKAHPVWKALARDQSLLNDYTDHIFSEYKTRFANDTSLEGIRTMGVFLGSANGYTPEMRAWCVDWLEDRSVALGRYVLDDDSGRFVGIAPEALSASSKSAGNINSKVIVYTSHQVKGALEELGFEGLTKTLINKLEEEK